MLTCQELTTVVMAKPLTYISYLSSWGEVSEPHTSELNGGIFLRYTYICIVRCTSNARVRAPRAGERHVI